MSTAAEEEVDEADGTSAGDISRAKGKMDPEKWAKARYLAEVEGVRASEIARQFSISPSLVSRYFNDNGIVVGSKKPKIEEKAVDEVAARLSKVVTDFAAQRKVRISQTKVQHFAWASEIAAETMKLVAKAKTDVVPFGNFEKDLKMLVKAGALICKMREEKMIVLDAINEIDETSLPIIEFRDLSDEDITAIQQVQLDDDPVEDGERSEVVET